MIHRLESKVSCYNRSFPTTFERASGETIVDVDGVEYIDFFAGAGALNYGHNNVHLRDELIRYLESEGVTHGLDFATAAKDRFLTTLERRVLAPRALDYRVQFVGPTGTNAVEAALKLARKVTGREPVIAFTGAFHGMTLGSLALTANGSKRAGAGLSLGGAQRMPYAGYFGPDVDTLDCLEQLLADPGSGVDLPAAIVLETIQAEGGVRVASDAWLRRLERLARRHDILLIIDDIQVGCGRTGPFFSFESAGLKPDIVCLSKSLSGYGLPFAVDLIRPDLDEAWSPGEHNGTFRGNNLAFVTATAALERYWTTDQLHRSTIEKGARIERTFLRLAKKYGGRCRGRGMIVGLELKGEAARRVATRCFDRHLIIETAGARNEVLKALPPLTISDVALERGLRIIEESTNEVMGAVAHVTEKEVVR